MIVVGETDSFERKYMEKFRAFASEYGEFINYEHDRGARDIGMHLTRKLSSGKEQLTSALVWFQMKGKMAKTISLEDYEKSEEVKISLSVNHLRYWFLQPMPTYLVLFIESAEEFLILNISEYVKNTWGREILTLNQETATINVPTDSKLDSQAFRLILQENDIKEWKKALGDENEHVDVCYRDYDLIWHLATAESRAVSHKLEFWDWQSKTRSQLYIYEESETEKVVLREHWQYMMSIEQLEDAYPYIEFFVDQDAQDWWADEDDNEVPDVVLSNGDVMSGVNAAYEYFAYECGIRLNDIGLQMFEWIKFMSEIGLIEIKPGKSEFVSFAPWHSRSV
ncbi:DUF4365 domain-containing protein [Shewanella sp. TC10]|uniref:DUF4365 domain-containing protein n=1 Tax=Shewanella sp. TC10 TaxID=1419739 RepID=UPI00129D434A|nr:DUF4365 domain-containing protein [Shewanella sp. TC10]